MSDIHLSITVHCPDDIASQVKSAIHEAIVFAVSDWQDCSVVISDTPPDNSKELALCLATLVNLLQFESIANKTPEFRNAMRHAGDALNNVNPQS